MASPSFQIVTRGMPARPDEWFRALNATPTELPQLSDDDKRSARIRHMTDEQYARHLMLRASARKREAEEAEKLGNAIVEILQRLGGEFQLTGIGKRGLEPGWHAFIEFRPRGTTEKFFDVPLPTEDFSDERNVGLLNTTDMDQIRGYLVSKLGIEGAGAVAS
jgi:hypothetical protein